MKTLFRKPLTVTDSASWDKLCECQRIEAELRKGKALSPVRIVGLAVEMYWSKLRADLPRISKRTK